MTSPLNGTPWRCRNCNHQQYDETATICTVCRLDRTAWDRHQAEYIAKMAQLTPEQKRHSNCDHAYGICQEVTR